MAVAEYSMRSAILRMVTASTPSLANISRAVARIFSRSSVFSLCLRSAAPSLWADAERGDLRLAVHAMNVDCSDEVFVRAEVTILPCEQPADHGQSFRR